MRENKLYSKYSRSYPKAWGFCLCLFVPLYDFIYMGERKAEEADRISHLIFYQNLYLSYLWGVWVDLSLLCSAVWGVFLSFSALIPRDKHKMAETFLWRIITFLLLLQWWRIYQLTFVFFSFSRSHRTAWCIGSRRVRWQGDFFKL